jgi:cytochrome c oxidase subunit II
VGLIRLPSLRPKAAGPSRRRVLRPSRVLVIALLALTATGCGFKGGSLGRFGFPSPVTVQGHRVLGLWVGSFWAALAVGAMVIGLILWCALMFRRKGQAVPRQVQYNVPIEVIYTVVPFVVICVLFYFTAVDESYVNKLSNNPGVRVGVVGFRWSWTFDYLDDGLQVTGRPGQDPVLTLPIGRKIEFRESSPDVIHSFWVPDFLFKRDVIPGRLNRFELTVNKTGWFKGRCAELCGAFHDHMLFLVHSVTPQQYDAWLADAKRQAKAGTNPIYSTIGSATTTSAPSGSKP